MHAPVRRRALQQAGLSLVELLVALALGAFITIGIIQIFTANQETYRVNIGQARMQENARFALEFLKVPIRMAGYAGCFSDEGAILSRLGEPGGVPLYEADFASGVLVGHEATTAATWSPALAGLPAAIPTADIVGGTDVLTVRLFDPGGPRLANPLLVSTAPLSVRMPADLTEYGDNTVMVVSDCQKATIFQSRSTTVAGATINIDHNVFAGPPGNTSPDLTDDGSSFDVDATVHALETQTFYIAPGTGTNNRGVNPLSLWRRFGTQAPAELVEGIEDLQILLGVDTDTDGIPNRYRTINNLTTVEDLRRVVTVRISVTANSVDVVNETGDGLLRRTFTNTIALRHRIGG